MNKNLDKTKFIDKKDQKVENPEFQIDVKEAYNEEMNDEFSENELG